MSVGVEAAWSVRCVARATAKARGSVTNAATGWTQRAPLRTETPTRKVVTIVFADLTGSTAIGERTDPEAFRALIGPFFTAMRTEVEPREGSIAKFQGDGVMAVFGIPDVREDDALRALDAAIGMRAALERLSGELQIAEGTTLSLKVGVNTGEVVFAERDEDIVGDCVNVASRLEGAAAPGEILVGEDTWRVTRSDATFEAIAPLVLKGKTEPVPAYRLVSVERAEAAQTRFVGRDVDLQTLVAAFERAVDRVPRSSSRSSDRPVSARPVWRASSAPRSATERS